MLRFLKSSGQLMPKNIYRLVSSDSSNPPVIYSSDVPPNPKDLLLMEFDETLYKINENMLKHIGERTEKPNLAKTVFQDPPFPVKGEFHIFSQFMVCMACQLARRPEAPIINVWFTVNPGSHWSHLSKKTCEALYAPNEVLDYFPLKLQDPNYVVDCFYDDQFKEVNILGSEALEHLEISTINIDWRQRQFVLSRNYNQIQ